MTTPARRHEEGLRHDMLVTEAFGLLNRIAQAFSEKTEDRRLRFAMLKAHRRYLRRLSAENQWLHARFRDSKLRTQRAAWELGFLEGCMHLQPGGSQENRYLFRLLGRRT